MSTGRDPEAIASRSAQRAAALDEQRQLIDEQADRHVTRVEQILREARTERELADQVYVAASEKLAHAHLLYAEARELQERADRQVKRQEKMIAFQFLLAFWGRRRR